MVNISLLEKSIPVAPIKIAALDSCNELAQQVDSSHRMEEKLNQLSPSEDTAPKAPQFCHRCGPQLPPGGKTCPTCHHVNE